MRHPEDSTAKAGDSVDHDYNVGNYQIPVRGKGYIFAKPLSPLPGILDSPWPLPDERDHSTDSQGAFRRCLPRNGDPNYMEILA